MIEYHHENKLKSFNIIAIGFLFITKHNTFCKSRAPSQQMTDTTKVRTHTRKHFINFYYSLPVA